MTCSVCPAFVACSPMLSHSSCKPVFLLFKMPRSTSSMARKICRMEHNGQCARTQPTPMCCALTRVVLSACVLSAGASVGRVLCMAFCIAELTTASRSLRLTPA